MDELVNKRDALADWSHWPSQFLVGRPETRGKAPHLPYPGISGFHYLPKVRAGDGVERPHLTLSPATGEGPQSLHPEMHYIQLQPQTQGPEPHPGAEHGTAVKS